MCGLLLIVHWSVFSGVCNFAYMAVTLDSALNVYKYTYMCVCIHTFYTFTITSLMCVNTLHYKLLSWWPKNSYYGECAAGTDKTE